ncbi:DUF4833 domain-containing protein [Chitinophagaceae bacterium LWZ2-11]
MSIRTKIQFGIYKVIDPFVKLLIKAGLTPNAVTTIGLILNIGVAVIFIKGAETGNRGDLSYIGWAGALILFAGLFDMLDGQVARLGNMSSTFGALYDSVLDRYSELILFLGICYYLVAHHYFLSSLFAFLALIGSMMVSYVRARAEGLGIECKGGLMQRPERVIMIGLAAIECGITSHYIGGDYKLYVPGISFHVFETISIFTFQITLIAVLTNITAINRLRSSKKALDEKDAKRDAGAKVNGVQIIVGLLLVVALCAYKKDTYAHTRKKAVTHISQVTVIDPQDTFPIPPPGKNRLLYLQRTSNTNTIICDLNYDSKGALNEDEPVHVYWIRYTEKGQNQELSYIQRVFAYGMKTKSEGGGKYSLHFVSYKKYPMTLMVGKDGKYHVYGNINKKQVILHRIFIKINGGSFWSPNVEYVEVKGIDPDSGKDVVERLKI